LARPFASILSWNSLLLLLRPPIVRVSRGLITSLIASFALLVLRLINCFTGDLRFDGEGADRGVVGIRGRRPVNCAFAGGAGRSLNSIRGRIYSIGGLASGAFFVRRLGVFEAFNKLIPINS